MGFREKFLGTTKISTDNFQALSTFGSQSTLIGWRSDQASFKALQKLVQTTFQQSMDRVVHSQINASTEIITELTQQENELNYLIEKFRNEKPSEENLADQIQRITDYLGLEFSQIRWAMEPYTVTSQKGFQSLLDSLNEQTRQSLKEGIKCFEIGEYSFAKEQINNALTVNRTNYFAYQYLGFIAVLEDDSETALVNFKLARKFANTEYQQALALSHLALGCYALDEIEKACELSERSTQHYSSLGRFWYQLAKYQCLLESKDKCLLSLSNAIKCDWVFWGVVIVDTHFDRIRSDIYKLFIRLRQQQKDATELAINGLKKAINTTKQFGASYSLSKSITACTALEERYPKSHIFNYLELIGEAEQWRDSTFQVGEKYLRERISEKHSLLTQQETNKARELKDLDTPINLLTQEKKELKLLYKSWTIGCTGYILLYTFCLVLFVCITLVLFPNKLLIPPPNYVNAGTVAILFLISFVIAITIPTLFNQISYNNKVIAREKRLERQIQEKKKEARQLKAKIEEDSKTAKSKLEDELKHLENMFELCRNKRFI